MTSSKNIKISNYFGLETFKRCYSREVKAKEDNVVIALHWILTKHGFLCIGKGDAREIAGDESQSELLPDDWNADSENYLLRYMYSKRLFLLRVTKTSDDITVNFIKAEDMKISSLIITENDVNIEGLIDEKKSINKMYEVVSTFIETPPAASVRRDDDGLEFDLRRPKSNMPQPTPVPDFRNVGRRDLDPFGVGPDAGMLMGIPGVSRPLARFDPINPDVNPLGPRGRFPFGSNPDNDEFMPPGSGSYFM